MAVVINHQLAYEAIMVNGTAHSVSIMPMIEEGLMRAGLSAKQIDLFVCVTGPGSFTGVRIGISTIKALAHVNRSRCLAVNALETLAYALPFNGIVCPLLDARAGGVYGAAFRDDKRVRFDSAVTIQVFLNDVMNESEEFLFVGSGALAHKAVISGVCSSHALFLPDFQNEISPSKAAFIGISRVDEAVNYLSLVPYYLKAPQAERERTEGRR